MFFMEQEYTEQDYLMLIQEAVTDPENNPLRVQLIDPIIKVLETKKGRDEYIGYGNQFLNANAEMLAKEYPTVRVTYPRRYVDNVLKMFGFDVKSIKAILKELLKGINQSDFKTLMSTPSNFVHAIVLSYSDMIQHRQLRDSARQQLGLTIYGLALQHSFHLPHPVESIMAYTYLTLNNTWNLVKAENIITWIGMTVDTCYAFFRTRLTIDMSITILVGFLSRTRTSFAQNMRSLANRYFEHMTDGKAIGDDLKGDEDFVVTNNTTTIRNNLMRMIRGGDVLYKNKGNLYRGIANLKNVKEKTLYEMAQKVDHKDITNIMDLIFYVFIVKEENSIDDINSSKYIGRITNFPTQIDRAIAKKPVIIPLTKKYGYDSSIVKAYICLVATFILQRINEAKPDD